MPRLALYLFGPPPIELDGEPVHISRRKVVALLAYLAMTGTPHSRDALATLLWPERSQSRARAYLRRALSELNRALGEGVLEIDRESAGLDSNAGLWLDVDVFRQHLAQCATHGHPAAEVCQECLLPLEEAVGLYHDDFLAGFTLRDSPDFDEWQFFQSEGLRDELVLSLERLVRWHRSKRQHSRAIAHARRWLVLDPLHEPVHRHLMQLYDQAGQRSAALRQYQECVRVLEAELGLPPTAATTALYDSISRRAEERDESPTPSPTPRYTLPAQSTPFIGRQTELAQIRGLLQDPNCRLLTLIGPGGSGKTRLALQAAEARLDANVHKHGVFFVSLAPLSSAEAIVPTVADVLGFRFFGGGTPQQQLLDFLRQRNLLLIMDNYEHLLAPPVSPPVGGTEGGAQLVSDVIKTAPNVKILATSRARLNVGGEHRFLVRGMDYPEEALETTADARDFDAVQLFIQGACRAQLGFEAAGDVLQDIVRICHTVEGLPLGVRLAAAWVDVLPPAEIAAQISQSLDLLETERRDVPERQRSVRAAFDHSWHLLTDHERAAMQALSVFRGSFSRQGAQCVSGALLRDLRALVDKSLLQPVPGGRYEVHELLRQYAAEKLGANRELEFAARNRHCAHYADALQGWAVDLKSSRSPTALVEIEGEMENVRAAWNWSVQRGDLERLDQAIEGLCLYHLLRRRPHDGEALCQSAADQLAASHPVCGRFASAILDKRPAPGHSALQSAPEERGAISAPTLSESRSKAEGLRVLAKLLTWQAWFCWYQGRGGPSSRLQGPCLALLEDLESAGYDVRLEKARILLAGGDLEQCLPLVRTLDDQWWKAQLLANCACSTDDYYEARESVHEVIALFETLGDQSFAAHILTYWGWKAFSRSNYGEAKKVWEESLPLHRSLGDQFWEAITLHSLGCAAWVFGDCGRAHHPLEEAAALQRALGDQRGLADSLHQLANVVLYQGRFERAERLARESIAISRAIGHRNTIAEGCRALGMALIGLGEFAEAQSPLEESAAVYTELGWVAEPVFANIWLSRAKLHLGQTDQARTLGESCLTRAREAGVRREIGLSLLLLGDVALAEGACREACGSLQDGFSVLQAIGYQPELGPVMASVGAAMQGLGKRSEARKHVQEALRMTIEIEAAFPLLRALPAAALLLCDAGQRDRAVEAYALASRYPYVANSRWFEDVVGKHIAAASESLPPDVVAAAKEHGRARDLRETAEELLGELGAAVEA
jgi:predicted ATPase/DNA-binding SARP family transcriptional activator